jgi:hypothetical protein
MSQPQRVTEYLVEDHRRLAALLERATAHTSLDQAAFAAFRAGLLRHIAIEEKLLFPTARRARGGSPIERQRELRIEHAAIASLLVPTPDLALCKELVTLLTSHEAKEEGAAGVYAACEQCLSEEESHALAVQAQAFPGVRVAPHFDGPQVPRTAARALVAAQRLKPSDKEAAP